MSRTRLLLFSLSLVLVASVASPATQAGAGSQATAAAAKECKQGYKRVKVRSNGRTRTVCRKKKRPAATSPAGGQGTTTTTSAPGGPSGPSIPEVESIIVGQLKAGAPYPLGEDSVEVVFEKPTQILPMVMYNPYANDPLTATGEVPAWPVRAWVRSVTHRDDTPEDDTYYAGCLAHLNSSWPYDSLYMFWRGQSGEWTFTTTTAKAGDCG